LLNLLGDVKARVQDKLGIVDFPMPQFILIGKQSVGKSRLIEALAGETFNFISGTLGSRRPTVLEFRNMSSEKGSRWFVRDRKTNQWGEHKVQEVMKIVGDAHEELGDSVSEEPLYVRLESPHCVDMQITDLPGFRDFAVDSSKQDLSNKIAELVTKFMQDQRNVMLCVEQAGDAATMSTLARARKLDPEFNRTVLIRSKLDKYYVDLTPENVNQWVDGFGDLPPSLTKFSLTLPWWQDGKPPSKSFLELREYFDSKDVQTVSSLGVDSKKLQTIGYKNFAAFMEVKVEQMFAAAIDPVLDSLKKLQTSTADEEQMLKTEYTDTDPLRVVTTTRDCGMSFASAVQFVMEGQIGVTTGQMDLETELKEFHEYHARAGTDSFPMLPSDDFFKLSDYTDYLLNEANVMGADIRLSGGAQWLRLLQEVEIFLRFSEIAVETKKRDVIQARGVSMTSLTWRDVVVKLLSNEAHLPLQRRVRYVGERITWFFAKQKELILDYMISLEKDVRASHSALLWRHGKLIKQNEMIKHLVFETYDEVCSRQLTSFTELFENMLTSTFSNPWVFLKGATSGTSDGELPAVPPEDRMLEAIPMEIQSRSGIEGTLSRWLSDIPTEAHQIDEAVDKVQMLILKTYSFIRSQVCDQVELFAESFFKLPMLRRLNEDMGAIELSAAHKEKYERRRVRLQESAEKAKSSLVEIDWCVNRMADFKHKTEAKRSISSATR